MTISNTSRIAGPFLGNGITTDFPFGFKVFGVADLLVQMTTVSTGIGSTLALNFDYFVTLNVDQDSNPGGTIKMLVAPASTISLVIASNLAPTQTLDLTNQGGFYPTVINNALDRIVILIQQIYGALSRTVRFPLSDGTSISELPSAGLRAGKLLGFDSNGNFSAIAPTSQSATDVALSLATAVNAYAAAAGSSLIGFLQGTGGVKRTVQAKLQDFVNAQDYPTLAAAFAASNTVFVTTAYPVAASFTVGKTQQLVVLCGGSLTLAAGITLTVNGDFYAPITKVFNGTGTATGIRVVYPEWWGAQGNGTGDDQPMLTAATTCAMASAGSAGHTATVLLTGASYQVANTWTITPTPTVCIVVKGLSRTSTSIVPSSAFPNTSVILIDGTTSGSNTDFVLRDFAILPSSGGIGLANVGLQVGSYNVLKRLQATQSSLVENIFVYGFPCCYLLCHSRLVRWVRCSGWNNNFTDANTVLKIIQNGGFTGDMTFDSCQFVGNVTNTASTTITISSTGGVFTGAGAFTVSGIRFTNCIIYQSYKQVYILAQNGALLNDIWFSDSCQFDGGGNNSVNVVCNSSGTIIRNINITGCYFAGTVDVLTYTIDAGILCDCSITGNYINGASAHAISFFRSGTGVMTGHVIQANRITDNNNTTGPAIEINGAIANFQIIGNIANRLNGSNNFKYFITVQSGASQFVLAENNAGAISTVSAINDLSGAVTKAVANNI